MNLTCPIPKLDFDTINLGARDIGNRTGRDQRRGIDAQLGTIAERECLRVGDQIARRLNQPLCVASEMHRVVIAADDLACNAGRRAVLLAGAGR